MSKSGFTLLFLMGLLLSPLMVTAIAPPEVVAKRNLEANFILAGEVLRIHADDTPPHFVLKVAHVIKGIKQINRGDKINVLLTLHPPKTAPIARHTPGILPVKVEEGRLVLVYLDHSGSLPGYFKPILEGLSVVTIGHPLEEKAP